MDKMLGKSWKLRCLGIALLCGTAGKDELASTSWLCWPKRSSRQMKLVFVEGGFLKLLCRRYLWYRRPGFEFVGLILHYLEEAADVLSSPFA